MKHTIACRAINVVPAVIAIPVAMAAIVAATVTMTETVPVALLPGFDYGTTMAPQTFK